MLCGFRSSVLFTYCWQLLCVLEGRAVAKPRVICCSCITYFIKSKYQRQHQFAVLPALSDRTTLKESCLCSRKKLILTEKGAGECSDDGQEDTMQSLHHNALTSCCSSLPTQVPEPSGSHLAEASLRRAEEELISCSSSCSDGVQRRGSLPLASCALCLAGAIAASPAASPCATDTPLRSLLTFSKAHHLPCPPLSHHLSVFVNSHSPCSTVHV